jgi:hypothetical protein
MLRQDANRFARGNPHVQLNSTGESSPGGFAGFWTAIFHSMKERISRALQKKRAATKLHESPS